MLDVVVTRFGPQMVDADDWMFHATILDGSERHDLVVSYLPDGKFSDTVRLVIAEAFRLGKEAR